MTVLLRKATTRSTPCRVLHLWQASELTSRVKSAPVEIEGVSKDDELGAYIKRTTRFLQP
ncbi:hypothetical protein [Streptomyces sp. NPDC059371]|uniref:hypothetical protein n=1 Tax=Streptomyces sp. NPDC059371 TaxID=3346812 RepID=UPI00367A3600